MRRNAIFLLSVRINLPGLSLWHQASLEDSTTERHFRGNGFWCKLTSRFSYDKTTSIIFRFLYFPMFFFSDIINPQIAFMSFFVFIVFSQADHTVIVDVGWTKSIRVRNKVLKIEHINQISVQISQEMNAKRLMHGSFLSSWAVWSVSLRNHFWSEVSKGRKGDKANVGLWESDINTRVKYMRSIHLPSLPFPPQRWDLHHLSQLRT